MRSHANYRAPNWPTKQVSVSKWILRELTDCYADANIIRDYFRVFINLLGVGAILN